MDVIVAANDIQVGAKIGDQDLKVVKYPPRTFRLTPFVRKRQSSDVPRYFPSEREHFVVPDRLAGENAGAGLSALIATGMRAVAVRVNDVTALAGFVEPGTRVDVLVTGNATSSSEPWTMTILQDVTVLATGHRIERSTAGEPQSVTVVTLLLATGDAGKRLRCNPMHINQEKPATISRTTLFGDVLPKLPVKLMRAKYSPMEPPEPGKLEIDIFRGTQKQTIHLRQ